MKFSYVAFDRSGKRVPGTIDAAGEAAARDTLSAKGLFVVELTAGAAAGSKPARKQLIGSSPGACLSQFTRQVSILVGTGTPLVPALLAVERQVTDERFRAVVASVRSRVEEGATLADAMRRHPKYFDAVAVSLVSAGEASGTLEAMLGRLAVINRQQEAVKRSVTGAMVYPAMLVTIAGSVMVLMLLFVIPRFSVLFESLDTPLPPTTAVLMAVSDHLRGAWWWEIPGAIAAFVGLLYWLMSPKGRGARQEFALRVPVLQKLVVSLSMARIARLLGVLLESRVPLLDALQLTRAAMTHPQYAGLLERAEQAVTRGESISSVLAGSDLFSPGFVEALRNGEESGQVGAVLSGLAGYLDEDNAVAVKAVTSLLEPVILVVLGLVVGSVAVSMFLPLFDATAAASPGGH